MSAAQRLGAGAVSMMCQDEWPSNPGGRIDTMTPAEVDAWANALVVRTLELMSGRTRAGAAATLAEAAPLLARVPDGLPSPWYRLADDVAAFAHDFALTGNTRARLGAQLGAALSQPPMHRRPWQARKDIG